MMVITSGERLFLWLRREGYTQKRLAGEYNVTQARVSMWIHGLVALPPELEKRMGYSNLRNYEELVLMRRRMNWSLKEMASAYGMTHLRLIDIEYGNEWDEGYSKWLRESYAVS